MRSEAEIREAMEVIKKVHRAHEEIGGPGNMAAAFQLAFLHSALLWVLGEDAAFARSFLEPQKRAIEEAERALARMSAAKGN